MKKLWVLAALALGLSALSSPAAVLYPTLFGPLRDAIVAELEVLTNNPALTPEERRQLRLLNQARRNIDRAGRPSLFGDVQILTSLTTSLSRAFPEGEFDPLLQFMIADYALLLSESAANLETTIDSLPASTARTLASNTLANASALLTQVDTSTDVGSGISAIARAASRLRSAEGFITRAQSGTARDERLTAIIAGRRFNANPVTIDATFSLGTETLTIVARELGGSFGNRAIQIILSDVTVGTTTHTLGSQSGGDYATYTASTPTNNVTLISTTGNAIVTVNPTTGIANGRFSFDAADQFGSSTPVRITSGDFSVRLNSP